MSNMENLSTKNTEITQEVTSLSTVPKADTKIITRKDGTPYSVRNNRDRFLYPHEWMKFLDDLTKPKHKMTFEILMGTGARINECIHIKVGDVDFVRNTIILRVTKVKARKGEKNPRPRTVAVSSQLIKKIKAYTQGKSNEEYLGLTSKSGASKALQTHLKAIGIKDSHMISIHNIRKTHGNYLKALGIDGAEICTRLGHDYNTFLKSYSSPDVFTYKDMEQMRLILGDLYQRRIKWP